MTEQTPVRLDRHAIERLSSPYINEGRKQESWRIDMVEISDQQMSSRVSMTSTYVSSTDPGGFHLSIFSTMEFLSQLMIIYMHVCAGLQEKTREVWMAKAQSRCIRPIRNAQEIRIEMTAKRMRRYAGKLHVEGRFTVTDAADGLMLVTLSGTMS